MAELSEAKSAKRSFASKTKISNISNIKLVTLPAWVKRFRLTGYKNVRRQKKRFFDAKHREFSV